MEFIATIYFPGLVERVCSQQVQEELIAFGNSDTVLLAPTADAVGSIMIWVLQLSS